MPSLKWKPEAESKSHHTKGERQGHVAAAVGARRNTVTLAKVAPVQSLLQDSSSQSATDVAEQASENLLDRSAGAVRFTTLFVFIIFFYTFGLRWDTSEPMMSEDVGVRLQLRCVDKKISESLPLEKGKALNMDVILAAAGERSFEPSLSQNPQDFVAESAAVARLPTAWPQLIKLNSPMHLSVSADVLRKEAWNVDVLGFLGKPLLRTSLQRLPGGDRILEISSHGTRSIKILSISSTALEVTGMGGALLGSVGPLATATKAGGPGAPWALWVRAADGKATNLVATVGVDYVDCSFEFLSAPEKISMASGTLQQQSSSVPYKHISLVAKPGVDSVLMLACLLARVAFGPMGNKEAA